MNKPDILVFDNSDDFITGAAALIAAAVRSVLQQKKVCRISLAGGTTPGPVYAALVNRDVCGELPLNRIEILFGDERAVSKDHKDSNYAMAAKYFGASFDLFKNIYPMETVNVNYDEAANKYSRLLEQPVDIMILGLGEDAHVASVFPNSSIFGDNDKRAAFITGSKPPPLRMTVTPKVIKEAKRVFVLAKGEGKAEAVNAVFSMPSNPQRYPGQLALSGTWIMDRPAASELLKF